MAAVSVAERPTGADNYGNGAVAPLATEGSVQAAVAAVSVAKPTSEAILYGDGAVAPLATEGSYFE